MTEPERNQPGDFPEESGWRPQDEDTDALSDMEALAAQNWREARMLARLPDAEPAAEPPVPEAAVALPTDLPETPPDHEAADQAWPETALPEQVSLPAPLAEETAEPAGQEAEAVRLGRQFSPLEARVMALSGAIARHPEAPVNYILRGEALAEAGLWEAALSNFDRGLALAEAAAAKADWGYIYQALAERARAGLRRCQDVLYIR